MMPSPKVSNWGRPARPSICMMSSGLSSHQRPFSGLYTCVPLMITVCAGRLTPHASVAVLTSTCVWPSANSSSTSVRSERFMPAWWMAKPKGSSSFSSGSTAVFSVSDCSTSRDAESSRSSLPSASAARKASFSARAVRPVSLRVCTKMITCDLPACSSTFLKQISFISASLRAAFFSVTPMYCCCRGQGRKEPSK